MNITDLLEDNVHYICGFLDRFSASVLCATLRIKPHKSKPPHISTREKIRQSYKFTSTITLLQQQYGLQQLETISPDVITLAKFSPEFVRKFPEHKIQIRDLINCAVYYDNVRLFDYLITQLNRPKPTISKNPFSFPDQSTINKNPFDIPFNPKSIISPNLFEIRQEPIKWIRICSKAMLEKILTLSNEYQGRLLEAVILGGNIETIKHLKVRSNIIQDADFTTEAFHGHAHVTLGIQMRFKKTIHAYYAAIYRGDLAMMQYLHDLDFPLVNEEEHQPCIVGINKQINLSVPLCDFAAELDRIDILEWLLQHNLYMTELTTFHLARHQRWEELSNAIKNGAPYDSITILQIAINNNFDLLWDLIQYESIETIPLHVLYYAVKHKSSYFDNLYEMLASRNPRCASIAATEYGNIELLKTLPHISKMSYCFTTDLSVLQWIYDQGIRYQDIDKKIDPTGTAPTRIAAELQQLDVLEWMLRNDFLFDFNDLISAAGDKAPVILAWFRRKIDHMQ
jgi:hypothetical protein